MAELSVQFKTMVSGVDVFAVNEAGALIGGFAVMVLLKVEKTSGPAPDVALTRYSSPGGAVNVKLVTFRAV